MIFYYTATPVLLPRETDALLLLRPEIPLQMIGPAGRQTHLALVDSGADYTIFPITIARTLGIELGDVVDRVLIAYGGQRLDARPGRVRFQLCDPEQTEPSIVWDDEVLFLEGSDEGVVLGHDGFLNYFTAKFDGSLGTLELTANDLLPTG